MDAINIMCQGDPCNPYAGLDMENGICGHLFAPAGTRLSPTLGASDGQHSYAHLPGNSESGDMTSTGISPLPKGYQPMTMKQQGAIILGTGGENSNWASSYFFKDVMTRGMPGAKTMEAVQRNVVAAGYAGHFNP